MCRYSALILFLACGIVHGIQVNVKNNGTLCLYADLKVNFSVSYETINHKNETVVFELPPDASSNGSLCGSSNSTLKLTFGEGHSWSMKFSHNQQTYEADSIVFVYNLKDAKLFPNASTNDTKTATVKPFITSIGLNTSYSCKSQKVIEDERVNQTLWNVLIQAFVANGNRSENLTSCAADQPTTTPTPRPTTAANTTVVPRPTSTAKTTVVPSPTTTAPTPTLPTPTTGNYNVTTGVNGSVCLLASFGLRIGVKKGNKYEEMNLDPAGTNVSGLCGVNSSELTLVSSTMTIVLTFISDSKRFHLQALNATGKTSSGLSFSEGNTNLSLWQASLSSSYMCNNEQNFSIDDKLNVYTFKLRVQPFAVTGGVFSTAHECPADDIGVLIPVIVAAVLAGLIVIVVVAYIIGRRKTHAGYQTL